ncbi:MAG: hypothetical protein QOI11_860 [Candidatus Eremiobacteraeota bacterium]|nr:hypothetical protein [Candidatus Eremiobacteraeota bacterium]
MNRTFARARRACLAAAFAALFAGAQPAAAGPGPKPSPGPRPFREQIMPTNIIPSDYGLILMVPRGEKTVELQLRSTDGRRALRIGLPTSEKRALANLPPSARLTGLTRSGENLTLRYTTGDGKRGSMSVAVDAARPITETLEFRSR